MFGVSIPSDIMIIIGTKKLTFCILKDQLELVSLLEVQWMKSMILRLYANTNRVS